MLVKLHVNGLLLGMVVLGSPWMHRDGLGDRRLGRQSGERNRLYQPSVFDSEEDDFEYLFANYNNHGSDEIIERSQPIRITSPNTHRHHEGALAQRQPTKPRRVKPVQMRSGTPPRGMRTRKPVVVYEVFVTVSSSSESEEEDSFAELTEEERVQLMFEISLDSNSGHA